MSKSSLSEPPSDGARKTPPKTTLDLAQLAAPHDLSPFEAEIVREMAARWREGTPARAEEFLARFAHPGPSDESAVRIIYEEICLREERGERVEWEEIFQRFPQWRDSLAMLLDCHRLIDAGESTPTFPEAGERLGELQLLCELGRGALGRVFLATQPALSDRPLVVKITPRSGDEHLSLARLQHTHVVPLYAVQDFPEVNLRALCMPFLGGTSWWHLLGSLDATPREQRTGRRIVELLAEAQRDLPVSANAGGPALRFLTGATYEETVCWIGLSLAEALDYAHQRGLVHLDIKPSNVLLAGDGQPMLLDFHLAREIVPAGSGVVDRLGGTRGYMSPEQSLATAAVREGRRLSVALDGRSDIYSLGVLLFESLVGQLPSDDELGSRQQMRSCGRPVSRGLEDVLHKCLAHDPDRRYGHAGQLAADLRRHLADLPLAGVPNRSLAERWRKWRRRKPQAFASAGMVALAAAICGAVLLLFHAERVRKARSALTQGQQHLADRDYLDGIERFQAGLSAIRWFPWQGDLRRTLEGQLGVAKRAELAGTLHTVVERLRFVNSFDAVAPARLRELDALCERIWQARGQIAPVDRQQATAPMNRDLHDDLLDLAVLWSDLRAALVGHDTPAEARQAALEHLDEAERMCGPSGILDLARSTWSPSSAATATSAADEAPAKPPQTAWEHYAVGRWLLRRDKLQAARDELRQAIELQPDSFWANFCALCDYRLENFADALIEASVCVALSPKSAECYTNRGLAHQALEHNDEALRDFDRALVLDPKLAVAAIDRAALLRSLGRWNEALTALDDALARGADPASVYYLQALVHLDQRNRPAALASLRHALQHDAGHAEAAALKSRLERGDRQ